MAKFIIGGLPRSGTTWLSVFLTTDDCVCLHDASAFLSKEELEKWEGGLCDTGLWWLEDWCKANTDKFILIDRNVVEVANAIEKFGLPPLPAYIYPKFWDTKPNKRFYFEDLFTEELAQEIWEYVHPEKPFNRIRWAELKKVYMSPVMGGLVNEEL